MASIPPLKPQESAPPEVPSGEALKLALGVARMRAVQIGVEAAALSMPRSAHLNLPPEIETPSAPAPGATP